MATVTLYVVGHVLKDSAYENYEFERKAWAKRIETSLPFEVGKSYMRRDGVVVECIELNRECALFSDFYLPEHPLVEGERLGWRYNRSQDRGRGTGNRFDCYKNVIPDFQETSDAV